jgi:hypothetical protein
VINTPDHAEKPLSAELHEGDAQIGMASMFIMIGPCKDDYGQL